MRTAFFLLLTVSSAFAAGPTGSREVPCGWTAFTAKGLGVRLLFEQCPVDQGGYVVSVQENRVEQHRPSDDRTFGGPLVLEMFRKPPKQSLEKALTEQFVAKLPPAARKGCVVQRYEKSPVRAPKQAFRIVATDKYLATIQAKTPPGDQPEPGCGPYGHGYVETYFEYHPHQSKTRFAFVVFGQDEHPLFDEHSVEFEKD